MTGWSLRFEKRRKKKGKKKRKERNDRGDKSCVIKKKEKQE